MARAITLPFSIDTFGKVSSTTDTSIIWKDRVRSVLATTLTERIMRDSFGTEIASAVFEGEQVARTTVETQVRRAFGSSLSALTLNSVDLYYDDNTNQLNVSVVYTLPNNEVQETSYAYVSVNGTNPLVEETL